MPNPYVNKVQKSDGTTIIDISDTTAVASDVAEGKYFYLATGQKVSGTASGGGGSVLVEENENSTGTQLDITATSTVYLQPWFSVTPSASEQQISPASGYDAMSGFTVEAIPSEYVIPTGTFSISSNGTYNVEAFAQAEVLVSGGGGGDSKENEIIERTISGTYENSEVYKIESYAFAYCSNLASINFPLASNVWSGAFYNCINLTTASIPIAGTIGSNAFYSCRKLENINIQNAGRIMEWAFVRCYPLSTVILNASGTIKSIYNYAFASCYKLLSLYLLTSEMYTLGGASAFATTPISTYTTSTGGVQGSIFVPEGIYNSYITATNWAIYSARFVSLTSSQVQNVIDYGRHDP